MLSELKPQEMERYGTIGAYSSTWVAVYQTILGGMRCPHVILGEKDAELVRNFAECLKGSLKHWGIEVPTK